MAWSSISVRRNKPCGENYFFDMLIKAFSNLACSPLPPDPPKLTSGEGGRRKEKGRVSEQGKGKRGKPQESIPPIYFKQ